jgi:hypothetical protein
VTALVDLIPVEVVEVLIGPATRRTVDLVGKDRHGAAATTSRQAATSSGWSATTPNTTVRRTTAASDVGLLEPALDAIVAAAARMIDAS